MQYLEQQLNERRLSGKAIALAGISAGMVFVSGCSSTSSGHQGQDGQEAPDVEIIEKADTASDSIFKIDYERTAGIMVMPDADEE